MCLAIPVRVVELRDGDHALVDLGGVRKEISLALVDDVAGRRLRHPARGLRHPEARPGEAERTLALFAELGPPWQRPRRAVKYIDEFRDGDRRG
jgi:hydrogenase expression/formation protein HypC